MHEWQGAKTGRTDDTPDQPCSKRLSKWLHSSKLMSRFKEERQRETAPDPYIDPNTHSLFNYLKPHQASLTILSSYIPAPCSQHFPNWTFSFPPYISFAVHFSIQPFCGHCRRELRNAAIISTTPDLREFYELWGVKILRPLSHDSIHSKFNYRGWNIKE